MNAKSLWFAALIIGIAGLPKAAVSGEETNYDGRSSSSGRWRDDDQDARHLQGRWYLNGDPNKPTEININGRRLEASNEKGQRSRLEIERGGISVLLIGGGYMVS
jgi:hypothetical protein